MPEAFSSFDPVRPVILIVGTGSLSKDGLQQALSRQGLHVETTAAECAHEAVARAAPDLVVLTDDAARDAGIAVLDRLGASQSSSVVPAVVLGEALTLDERLAAFRHGAAAALSRSPSLVATAVRLTGFLREIPERTRQTFDRLGEPALRDFADEMSEQFRNKVAAAQSLQSDSGAQLVVGGGRALARLVDEFVQRRGRPLVVGNGRMLVAAEASRASQGRTMGREEHKASPDALAGLRVALADNDAARANALARDLRACGATVLVVDLSPSSDQPFALLQQLDPSVVVVGQRQLWDELLRRMYRDVNLRWATLLVVEWEKFESGPEQASAFEQLVDRLSKLSEAERNLQLRLRQNQHFNARLESTGPSRLLRALCESKAAMSVTVQSRRARFELELSEGRIVRAEVTGQRGGDDAADSPTALTLFSALESGRVSVASAAWQTVPEPTFAIETAPIVPIQQPVTAAAGAGAAPHRAELRVAAEPDTDTLDAGWTAPESVLAAEPDTDALDADWAAPESGTPWASSPEAVDSGRDTPPPVSARPDTDTLDADWAAPEPDTPRASDAGTHGLNRDTPELEFVAASDNDTLDEWTTPQSDIAAVSGTDAPDDWIMPQSDIAAVSGKDDHDLERGTPLPLVAATDAVVQNRESLGTKEDTKVDPAVPSSREAGSPDKVRRKRTKRRSRARAAAGAKGSDLGQPRTKSGRKTRSPQPGHASTNASPEDASRHRSGAERRESASRRRSGAEQRAQAPVSLEPVVAKRESGRARHPGRYSRRALVIAGVIAIQAAVIVGLVRLRGQPTVALTAPASQVPRMPEAKQGAMKALPTASKPKVSAPAGRSPVDRRSKLPVATNPTAHSCEELLRDEKLSTNRSRARSRAAVKRGRLGLVHGQLRRAQREFCRAVASDPTNASAQKELAELLLFLKDGNAGLARVRTALEIDPENRDLQGLHGDALARLGRYVEARQAWLGEARLKDGSEANRRLVKRFLRTARGFRFAHAWAEAERLYRRVAVIEPSNTEASLGLAQALRGLGQSDEARQWFDYANKLSHGEEGAQVTQELEAVR